MFGLGEYAVDFSALELDSLKTKFMGFISESQNIREKIKENLPAVLESSRDNIRFISEEIDKVYAKPKRSSCLILTVRSSTWANIYAREWAMPLTGISALMRLPAVW